MVKEGQKEVITMGKQNISDLIECYIKQLFTEDVTQLEIQRSEIANHFHCVPSQINYVIKTRFTISKGYRVESKRGGGGYIRIHKIYVQPHQERLQRLQQELPSELSFEEEQNIITQLMEWDCLTRKEAELILTMTSPRIFSDDDILEEEQKKLRSKMLTRCVKRLSYEIDE